MRLTNRQGYCLMTCFLLGNVLSGIGSGDTAEKTGYLAVFLSLFPLILLILIYRAILKRNEYRGFFQLIPDLFGKTAGNVLYFIIAGYSFLSAFLSIYNLVDFTEVSTYFRTPKLAVLAVILLVVLYICFSREKAMGRYTEIVLPIVLCAVLILFFFGFRHFETQNLVLVTSLKGFVKQGLGIFLAPFSEIIFVYFLFDLLRDKTNITKIATASCLTVTFLFSAIYLFNLLILGKKLMGEVHFPTFYAASVVEVGTVIEKAETLITFSYTFCDVLYSGACLYLCSKSIGLLFPKHKNAKKITAIFAVILILILLCIPPLSENLRSYYNPATLLMVPFTVGFPIALLTATLIRQTKTKGRSLKSCNNDGPKG